MGKCTKISRLLYNFQKMDFSRVQDEDGEYKLKDLSHEETGSFSREDGTEWMLNNFTGNRLGPPMTDLEFRRFYGQSW